MIETDDLHDPAALLPRIGLGEGDVPHVLAAARASRERIALARAALAQVRTPSIAAFALGSLGRHEVHDGSDLDLACVHDGAESDAGSAVREREACAEALRDAGFVVPGKTFGAPIDVTALVANVGGALDTNLGLTHRALILTESAWIGSRERAQAVRSRLFSVYTEGTARGRFMTALLNDLHRYYRTVCVDYRYKVDEAEKEWALRYLKLRHSRKTWHLANLALHCAARAQGEDGHDALLADTLDVPPLMKLAMALERLHAPEACAELWRRYDFFLGRVSQASVREALSGLAPEDEQQSAELVALKENADALERAAEEIVGALLAHEPSRGHLLRFGLL